MNDRRAIVCFSNLDWGHLRYRKQILMERLAAHYPVVYVNPPRACKARRPRRWNRVTTVAPQLWVYDPIVLPGVRRSRVIKALNDRLIAAALTRIPALSSRVTVWIYSPHARNFIDRLRPEMVVYDMADDYTVPGGADIRDRDEALELRKLRALEAEILHRADLVLCVSEPLVERARLVATNVHLVPNGCALESYEGAHETVPATRPRIGYVGTIAPRFDLDLMVELANARPEWDVELVGPVSPLVRVDHGRLPSNLRLTGEVPYADVPATIRSFDVCVLPLREIEFARASSPIQVYDYLAAGKPVVSTPVAQLERLPDLVATARGADEFARAIARALEPSPPAVVERRREFARDNSWDCRVARILGLLESRAGSREAA